MKVVLSPSQFFPHLGGVEEATLKLAQNLTAGGDDVVVVVNRHPLSLDDHEHVEGVEVRRVQMAMPGRRPASWVSHRRARRAVAAALDALPWNPDVVHVMCPSVQLDLVGRWADAAGVPLVISSHGETEMDAAHLYRRSRWMRRQLRHRARTAWALSACSRWTAEAASRIAPEFDRAAVVPNGVDLADWESSGHVPTAPAVAAWGRLVPQKGFDRLLKAWPLVTAQVPGAVLRLAGEGPEAERLAATAPPGVSMVGALDRAGVGRLLRDSRVAVVPSRVEPFGIVALEALAAGRGLVYARGTGLAEAAGPCGRPVDCGDPVALARAIVEELNNPTESHRASTHLAGRTWRAVATDYRALYPPGAGPGSGRSTTPNASV